MSKRRNLLTRRDIGSLGGLEVKRAEKFDVKVGFFDFPKTTISPLFSRGKMGEEGLLC